MVPSFIARKEEEEKTIMALTFQSLFFISFTILLITLPCIATNAKPQKLTTKLIHRHSVFHPLYDSKDDAQSALVPQNFIFLVNFSIGRPPLPQLAIMDTGSYFIWVQCAGCQPCIEQQSPRFDPSKSSTYHDIRCSPKHECPYYRNYSSTINCDSSSYCAYRADYLDGALSEGTFAIEQLQLETPDEDIRVIPDVIIGCGLQNREKLVTKSDGTFGLGNLEGSIVYKLGNRFSYCIGSASDPSYHFNQLTLGDGVTLEGYSTPFKTFNGLYYVTLEGISFGERRLNLSSNAFGTMSDGGGVVLDSGSALNYLPKIPYDLIRKEVASQLDGILTQRIIEAYPDLLCYNGIASRYLQGFPLLTFHLANGADLVLDYGSLFVQAENLFCMTIKQIVGRSIIGIWAQQYHNVAFDLKDQKIYFQRIDCELLVD